MIKITLSALIQLNNMLEGAKADLEKSLQGIRGKDWWHEGIDKDKRPSVKILFAELTATEEKIKKLGVMKISSMDWRDKDLLDDWLVEYGIMGYAIAEKVKEGTI